MPKSERGEVLSALTSKIFSAMLDDIIMDVALQSHHEVSRSRAICHVCNTHCNMAHAPGPSNPPIVAPPSRPPSPLEVKAANGPLGTGTSTPTSLKAEGNIYFECLNCGRQIASNRYAPHLSGCMGIGRRGAARGTNVKTKNSSESGRSPSPSELGNVSDDSRNAKGKGKSKSKRADEAEFNLKRKRPESPQNSSNKKQKNAKTIGSAVTRVKSDSDAQGISSNSHPPQMTGSQSKVPSKLRDSSTAPFVDRDHSSVSRDSSPGDSVSTPTSSVFSQSPFSSGGKDKKRKKGRHVAGTGPPKRPSPPRPPPPLIQPPEVDYTVDVEGTNETGSDTDVDSP